MEVRYKDIKTFLKKILNLIQHKYFILENHCISEQVLLCLFLYLTLSVYMPRLSRHYRKPGKKHHVSEMRQVTLQSEKLV